jgi:membrane protein DedA with SNARE-associated domain
MMNWFKNNLVNILALAIIVVIFTGAYLIGRYLTEVGKDVTEILKIIAVSVVVIFVLFCIISPFIKK